jgi:hypothetical protein
MTRRVLVAVMAMMIAVVSACGSRTEPAERAGANVFSVGECVVIPSTAPDTLRANRGPCTADPSYTVGAIADGADACPSNEYQHLPARFADPSTARLCLVPNLVAEHCYVLDLPIGVVQRAECTDRSQKGLLVQVTQRLDVRDQQACNSGVGQYAWPYPSPPRTYCTLTVF